MEKIPVHSSNIKAIGYDSSSSTLEVAFLNHTTYQYYGVPAHVYNEIMGADSHGHALHILVKTQKYRYERIA